MIDYKKFKKEIIDSVKEAEEKDSFGPDVHSKLLKIILTEMKNSWDYQEDALDEVAFVLNRVFSKAKYHPPKCDW